MSLPNSIRKVIEDMAENTVNLDQEESFIAGAEALHDYYLKSSDEFDLDAANREAKEWANKNFPMSFHKNERDLSSAIAVKVCYWQHSLSAAKISALKLENEKLNKYITEITWVEDGEFEDEPCPLCQGDPCLEDCDAYEEGF